MQTQTKLPAFKGKPLIEIPKEVPTIGFMEGDFGQAVLEEYKGRISSDYNNAPALNVLSYENGVVKGSNPFAVALVNQIISQDGLRVAKQSDLEKAMRINALQLLGQYEDTGLVLRSEGEPNSYLAKNLTEQIKARNRKSKLPVMIPLTSVELANDSNSPYGLNFKLKEDAEIIYAPILNKDGRFSSEDIDVETGLPLNLGEGNRNLYTRNSGLSGLYLGGVSSLGSGDDYLSFSNDGGRVVVVSAEGARKILKSMNLKEEKQKKHTSENLKN